jgi:hypothetical protein
VEPVAMSGWMVSDSCVERPIVETPDSCAGKAWPAAFHSGYGWIAAACLQATTIARTR